MRRILFLLLFLLQFAGSALATLPTTGVWWDPSKPGWGVAIQRNIDNTIFAVLFTYDETGRNTWYVMPDGKPQGDAVVGDVFEPTGPSYTNAVFDSTKVSMGAPVGTFRLALDGDIGSFEFDIRGIHSVTPYIEPFIRKATEAYSGVWWKPDESGWGMVNHNVFYGPSVRSTAFSALFVYAEDGHPTWFIMPDGQVSASIDTEYVSGGVFRPSGPPLSATFDSTKVDVGPVIGRFDFTNFVNVTFQYALPGGNATKALKRFVF